MEDKFTIYVEFFINADSAEEAEEVISELIMEGIVARRDEEETIYEYDITGAEPAEVGR